MYIYIIYIYINIHLYIQGFTFGVPAGHYFQRAQGKNAFIDKTS